MAPRTLIACLGNIFRSDDGFGVEVARRLAQQDLPDGVRVTDYGIRGMHLACDLAGGWDATILVDVASRGGEAGTVYVIEPEVDERQAAGADMAGALLLDPHGMQPDVMLAMVPGLRAQAGRVLLVGCEPATLTEGIGLSPPVAAAVDEAVRVVQDLAHRTGGGAGGQGSGGATTSEGGTAAAKG